MQSWYHLHAAQNLSIIAEQEHRLIIHIQIHQEQTINEGIGEVCEAAVHLIKLISMLSVLLVSLAHLQF